MSRVSDRVQTRRIAAETMQTIAAGLPDGAIDIIRDRLQMSARLIERSAGRAGPSESVTAWPVIRREFADLVAQEEGQDKDRERNILRVQPTAAMVTMAEECMAWRRYVTHPELLAVFNIWLRAKAYRRPWQGAAVKAGIARETAKRRLARALFLIAAGLARDGIRIAPASR